MESSLEQSVNFFLQNVSVQVACQFINELPRSPFSNRLEEDVVAYRVLDEIDLRLVACSPSVLRDIRLCTSCFLV
jgi:hypothetical protein